MFKNIKVKFAKAALVVLALQLSLLGLGTGATDASAAGSAPTGGTLTLKTVNHPTPGFTLTPTSDVYTLTTPLTAGDQFTSLTLAVIDSDLVLTPVAVYIDGDTSSNGNMVYDGTNWNYVPGTPVIFSEGKHSLAATFTDVEANETKLTARFITDSTAPTLSSVTATLGSIEQTGSSLTAVLGQSVGSVFTATLSEQVKAATGVINITGPLMGSATPVTAPYGTFEVLEGSKYATITPFPGNAVLADIGTFTFSAVAGSLQDLAGNPSAEITFDLAVTSNEISSIAAIVGTPVVGKVLTAGALTPALATATYQWQSAATVDGTYSNITGATLNKYTVVSGDLGKFIRVVATGSEGYIGTVNSTSTTGVTAPVAPAAVTGLTTFVDADGHVTLSWTNPTAGTFSNIRVYRVGEFYVDLGASSSSYTDTTTEKGQTYEYVVMVINADGLTNSTPQITVAVPAANVVAAAVSDTTSYYNAPEEASNEVDVKATVDQTKEEPKVEDENGFPTWGILLLLILAAVGGYLIWSQKPAEEVAPNTRSTGSGSSTKKK